MGLVRHRPHFAIDVFGKFQDVIGIGPAQVVGLVENFNPHTGISGFLNRRMFGGSGHVCFLWTQLAACSCVMWSMCESIFSTRPRMSSRTLRTPTVRRRMLYHLYRASSSA